MLTRNWINREDNVVYGKEEELVPRLAKDLAIPDLQKKIDQFRANPVKEGVMLRGGRRSSVLMFIPDLYFDDDIVMGGNIWLYMGEMRPAYCVYVPWEESEAER